MNAAFAGCGPLVYALLHTLWQGGLMLLLLTALLRCLPARLARARYLASLAALGGIVLAGIATWAWIDVSSRPKHEPPPALTPVSVSPSLAVPSAKAIPQAAPAEPAAMLPPTGALVHGRWIPWAAAFWACGAAVFLLRGLAAVLGAGRLRHRAREVTVPKALALAGKIQRALGIRSPIRLLTAEGIATPSVIGLFRPVVLLPTALLTGLPPEYLHAVLAHEFAHIARWDYLVNIGQMIVEALLFFNPFVWWISRQARLEREACCDRLAAALCETPGAYLEAVLACAEHARSSAPEASGDLPAAALAMDGPERGRSLVERAKRLLAPDRRGSARIPWKTLAGILLLTGVLLAAMGKSAVLAAEVLTPRERIERIEQIQKASATAPIEEKQITVSGTVVTEDGTPLSRHAYFFVDSRRAPSQSGYSATLAQSGTFSITIPSGMVHVAAVDAEHAPAFLGPLKGDGDLLDLRLVLPKGFPTAIHVTDPEGHALEGVRIEGRYQGPPQVNAFTLTTDAQGNASIAAASGEELTLDASKNEFQAARLEHVHLKPGEPLAWILDPAHPFKGRVVSEATGAPVAHAKISMLQVDGPVGTTSYSPQNGESLAQTDAHGKFTLDTLRDDTAYWLHVEADGFRPTASPRITVPGGPVEIKLGPPLHLNGRVIFPKENAPTGKVTIKCEQYVHISNHSHGVGQQTQAQVRDGVAAFAFDNLYLDPASTEIIVNGVHTKVPDFHASLDDFVVDLTASPRATAKELPKRWVVIRFDVPKGAPAPAGSLRVRYSQYGDGPDVQRSGVQKDIPIEKGEIWLEIPVPNGLSFDPDGLIGYAFQGYAVHKVAEGSEPAEIRLQVTPAGAIQGEVVEADGSPAHSVMISVVGASEKENGNFFSLNVKDYASGSGDMQRGFVATPLPMGETYRVIVHRGPTYVAGVPLRVDEKTPIQQTRIVIPEGTTLRGRVTDDDGQPVAALRFGLAYSIHPNQRFSGDDGLTGRDGRFAIPHVNLAAPGSYLLQFDTCASYVPAEVTVNPNAPEINVRLRKGLTLTGTAVNAATGQPMPGVVVQAIAVNPPAGLPFLQMFRSEAPTDEQGRFRFSNLPKDATVQFSVFNANFADPNARITAKAGQDEPVILKLTPER